MWKCAKCGREFEKNNQDHFCSEFPKSIDDYISEQNENAKTYLLKMREILKAALPETEERISWRMPTFWKGRNIVHFAAFKNHLGLFPGGLAVTVFSEKLKDFHTSKGTIQFPYGEDLPVELITEIAKCSRESTKTLDVKIKEDVAVVKSNDLIITDAQSALDFLATVGHQYNVSKIALGKETLTEDFFKLSTGAAGEIAQKFVNYGFRLAVIGDFSQYTSKALKDYIYECNTGRTINFVPDLKTALQKLKG